MITFFAVELDEECQEKLFDVQTKVSAFCKNVRLTKKENFHITIRYMGETNKRELELLNDAAIMAVRNIKCFKAEFLKLEWFERSDGRILYFSLKENKPLNLLFYNLEKALEQNGYKKEKRKFTAHVTIARDATMLKNANFSEINKELSNISFSAEKLSLMESAKSAGGLYYKCISSIEFC